MRSENAALAPVLFRNPEPDPNPNPDPENDEHASARLGSSLHSGGDDHVGLLVYFVVGTFRQV